MSKQETVYVLANRGNNVTMELTDYQDFLEYIESIIPLSKDVPS